MASTMFSTLANGVASAATYTAGAVPVILSGSAAAAGAAGNAVAGAVSQSGHVLQYASTAAKGVVGAIKGAVVGAVAAKTAFALTLKTFGFTAVGPAAGSYAAACVSSIAIANGGAVATGSLYCVAQAPAMGGGVTLEAPAVLAVGAVAGAGAAVWKAWFYPL